MVVGVIAIDRVARIVRIDFVDRIKGVIRVDAIDGIRGIAGIDAVDRIENVVVALILLGEAGIGKRRGERDGQRQEDDEAASPALGLPPMCGRFTQMASPAVIVQQFDAATPPLFAPRYNIAPSQPVATIRIALVTTIRQLVPLGWGLINFF